MAKMKTAAKAKKPQIGPGRLSVEQTAELPDRLMDAALSLFNEHGFADTTMDEIAKRAGASTKTLYSRFSNKGELLEAVVRRDVQRTVADHLRSFALNPAESAPREFLYKFGLQVCAGNLERESTAIVRVTFAEAHRFPVLMRMYREVTARGKLALANALRIWRDDGRISFTADSEAAGALCFDMMTAEMRARAVLGDPPTRAEVERYVKFAVDAFMDGVITEGKPKAKRAERK